MHLKQLLLHKYLSFQGDEPTIFDFESSKLTTILGPNGGGKSNLIRAVVLVRDALENALKGLTVDYNLPTDCSVVAAFDFDSDEDKTFIQKAAVKSGLCENDSNTTKELEDLFSPERLERVYFAYVHASSYVILVCSERCVVYVDGAFSATPRSLKLSNVREVSNIEAIKADIVKRGNAILWDVSIGIRDTLRHPNDSIEDQILKKIASKELKHPKYVQPVSSLIQALHLLFAQKVAVLTQHRQQVHPDSPCYYHCYGLQEIRKKCIRTFLSRTHTHLKNNINKVLFDIEKCTVEPYFIAENSTEMDLFVTYENGQVLRLDQVSGATVEVLMILFAIFGNDQTTVLLDEPAANVHPSRQSLVLDRILESAKSKTIIVITHSKKFISHQTIENIYWLSRNNTGTYVKYLSQYWKDLNSLQIFPRKKKTDPIPEPLAQRELIHHYPDILFASKVLFVEGITDFKFVLAIKSTDSTILNDVVILPAGGCDVIQRGALVCEFLGINCYALFDFDAFFKPQTVPQDKSKAKTWASLAPKQAGNIYAKILKKDLSQIYKNQATTLTILDSLSLSKEINQYFDKGEAFCWQNVLETVLTRAKCDKELKDIIPGEDSKHLWQQITMLELAEVIITLRDDEEMQRFLTFLKKI